MEAPAELPTEDAIVAFNQQPAGQKRLTEQMRGVLAETALMGYVRYRWEVVQPLVEFTMERVLLDYDAESQVDVGPPRSAVEGETIHQTIDRFRAYLAMFRQPPWTVQRLCEVLLEPQKQYSRLHKLAAAVEKLLLVTTELQAPASLPPPPLLSVLGPVNENPPRVYDSTQTGVVVAGSSKAADHGDEPGMGLAAAALNIKPLDVSAAPDMDADFDTVGPAAGDEAAWQQHDAHHHSHFGHGVMGMDMAMPSDDESGAAAGHVHAGTPRPGGSSGHAGLGSEWHSIIGHAAARDQEKEPSNEDAEVPTPDFMDAEGPATVPPTVQ